MDVCRLRPFGHAKVRLPHRVTVARPAVHVVCARSSSPSKQASTSKNVDVAKLLLGTVCSVAVGSMLYLSPVSPAIAATDVAKVGTCLLSSCQGALAKCIGDAECLKDLVCLNTCSGRPDETECQIRCGDLYADQAVDAFNACAVSQKKCVPQRVDEGVFPVPPDCSLVQAFDVSQFQGRWYITAGLNPLFDTFDCQVHFFASPKPGTLAAKINWRIPKPRGQFIERSTMQMFKQEQQTPALLLNHDNEYLHYQDDWYIIAQKPDEYVFVYYRGNNDAWKGYGGAVVYTRASSLPNEYIPELREAAAKAGLDWDKFKLTDNSCKPAPPQPSLVQEIEEDLQEDVQVVEQALEGNLKSFGRGFTVFEKNVEKELSKEEETVASEVRQAEKIIAELEEDFKRELEAEEKVVKNEFFDFLRGFGRK